MKKGFGHTGTAKRKPKFKMFQCKSVPTEIPVYVKPNFSICECCGNINLYVNVNHPEVVAHCNGLRKRSVASLLRLKGFVEVDLVENLLRKEMLGNMFN